MQYSAESPTQPPTVGARGAPQPAMVQCARCPAEMPDDAAIITEWLDPDDHSWYTEMLCQSCADPADLLLDRLIREDAARRVAG